MNQNTAAKVKLIVTRVLAYSFLIFLTAICLLFFYILIVNASKSNAELQGVWVPLFGSSFFTNLKSTLQDRNTVDVLTGFGNSIFVATFTSLLTTYFSALTAYAVHTYRFKGRKIVASFILAIMMIPTQVSSAGFILLAFKLGLTNNLWMLIIPSIASPATYFYMIQYLKATLPLDLVEASRMDGSSEFMTFNRIVLPIMKPALAVQMIFSFVASWNNYYMPSLLISDPKKSTLPIMLALLRSQAESQVDAGLIWMVVFLSIFPVMVVYIFLSKSIIKGVTSGSVKG